MPKLTEVRRREFVLAGAASSFTTVVHAAPIVRTSGLGPTKHIEAGPLEIGYHEFGSRQDHAVILLHGFPYDVHSYIDAAPLLAARGFRVIVPHLRGHGTTRFRTVGGERSGQQAAIGQDVINLMDALGIGRAILAGYDWGGRAACVVAALSPERCWGLVSVNGYLIQDIAKAGNPASARVERGFWYQFYFQTERGRAGLALNRREIALIMWRDNSPTWKFSDAEFARSSAAFENPDYVDIVIHSYRHRLGGAPGHLDYGDLETRLAAQPIITVPAVTLDGDSDGVVMATDGTAQAARFSARKAHRVIKGVGHNLPQEAPHSFVDAVLEVAASS